MIDELDLYLYEPEPFTSLNADPTVDKIDELEPENLDEALSNKQPETLGEDEAVLALFEIGLINLKREMIVLICRRYSLRLKMRKKM